MNKANKLALEIFRQLWLIVSVLFVTIGVSGLVVLFLGNTFGHAYVAGDESGVAYTATRCDDYYRLAPGSANCTEAALTHHYQEVVSNRFSAGVIGLLGLLLWYGFVRKIKTYLPPIIWTASIVSVSGFLAIIGLMAGLLSLVFAQSNLNGAGNPLSIGLSFGALTVYLIARFWRQSQKFVK